MVIDTDEPQVSARRAETRRRLMTAATEAFADKGIAGASVEEICDLAGFTRGAFYSNFESKDELCGALLRSFAHRHLRAAEEAINTVLAETVQPLDALIEKAVDTFVSIQPSSPEEQLLMMEMRLYAVRNPGFGAIFNALDQEMSHLFATLIGRGLEQRDVDLGMPVREAIDVLHAVHDKACLDSLLGRAGDHTSPTQLKAVLHALVRCDTPAARATDAVPDRVQG